MQPSALPSSTGSLAMYLAEINKYPLLTVDEEQRLARLYARSADLDAAHKLVTSNLRFVVKVAYEYRSYGIKMADLIQEGNIGLMKAVQKFDADKGIRLISYAVWWIRAFIQNYILKSWSLVKLGTTQAQRKLFFSLARTRRELEKFDGVTGDMQKASEGAIAKKLRVKPGEVLEMQQRMEGRDLSLYASTGATEWYPRAMRRVAGLPPVYWWLWLGYLLSSLGTFVFPFLALYLSSRGIDARQTGLVLSLLGVGAVLAGPIGGQIADRVGRKPALLLALAFSAVSALYLGFVRSPLAIAPGVLAFGLGVSMARPAMQAIVADRSEERRVGKEWRPRVRRTH